MALRVALGERSYEVRFGALGDLVAKTPEITRRPALLAIDEHVFQRHEDRLTKAFGLPAPGLRVVTVLRGEAAKIPETHHAICRAALDAGVERGGVLVAVGGGVTCDLVGFAAATYHRGVDWICVPTTVLAMVDASVGGKTGVNLAGAKNVVGAFHQPRGVLIDVGFVDTLEPRERASGLVEALKIAVMRDAALLDRIEGLARDHGNGAFDAEALEDVVRRAVALKAAIVAADEREVGERALLNFGHTIGHALEAATGFERWLHGEAVAIGMSAALRLSVRCAGLDTDASARVVRALESLGVPTSDRETPFRDVEAHLRHDKKVVGGRPAFVLTPRIGSGTFGHLIPQDVVRKEVASLFGGGG